MKIDQYLFVDGGGNLTEVGKELVEMFCREYLVPDDEVRLTEDDVLEAFKMYHRKLIGDDDGDFPFERLFDWFGQLNDVIDNMKPHWRMSAGGPVQRIQRDRGDDCAQIRADDDLQAFPFCREGAATAITYLVDELLPEPGVHMLVALPSALKTWLGLHVAICVSQGLPVLGRFETNQQAFKRSDWEERRELTTRRRSVVVDFEVGHAETERRLAVLGADERLLHVSHPKYKLTDEKFWTMLARYQARFIFLDSLSAGCGADFGELDNRFAEPLGRAMRFAEQHGCSLLFAHHSPKSPTLSDPESLFRGSGAVRAKIDSAYYLRKLPDGPNGEKRAEVSSAKSRKGADPKKFSIELTDERGLELYEKKEGAATKREAEPETEPELADKDKVLRAIADEPDGASGNEIADALEMRRENVSEALHELVAEQRIRIEGKGRATRCFVIPPKPVEPEQSVRSCR